jgi:hypothetical protein
MFASMFVQSSFATEQLAALLAFVGFLGGVGDFVIGEVPLPGKPLAARRTRVRFVSVVRHVMLHEIAFQTERLAAEFTRVRFL